MSDKRLNITEHASLAVQSKLGTQTTEAIADLLKKLQEPPTQLDFNNRKLFALLQDEKIDEAVALKHVILSSIFQLCSICQLYD